MGQAHKYGYHVYKKPTNNVKKPIVEDQDLTRILIIGMVLAIIFIFIPMLQFAGDSWVVKTIGVLGISAMSFLIVWINFPSVADTYKKWKKMNKKWR